MSVRLLCSFIKHYKDMVKELDIVGRRVYITLEVPPDKMQYVRAIYECLRGG